MAKLQQIVIKTESGGFQYLTLQNYEESVVMANYGSAYDEAVSGALRSNMRGLRISYTISYSKCLEPSTFVSVCNNIAQDILDGLAFVMIGQTTANMIKVVLDDDFVHRVQYTRQMARYVPKITLTSFELFDLYPSDSPTIDWRYVSEIVDQPIVDYDLITQAETLQEDYGFIS